MQDGNDKGFALYDQAKSVIRDELSIGSGLNDLFTDVENSPADLQVEAKDFARPAEEQEESLAELDLSPGELDKHNDAVRVYLHEMGMVALLTREGEIELAKQIERGQNAVAKALSRSRLVVRLLIDTARQIERGMMSIADVLQVADPITLNERG